jgi:serine/threonine protein kinase
MGEVYRATDATLGRVVAIKMLAERHARDADVRARFTREALAAARLSGEPYVVTVFDVGEHEGRPFIVMEYLDGGTVHEQLRRGRVPHEEALEWLRQAAAAIDAAHRHGVVHRDVKPANLLLDKDDVVRVSDFGIASATGMDTLTLPGTVLGTAGYLSPEQARGQQATPASDRYALGVVAFELLTGRRPFAADTPVTEAFGHLNADVPSAERIAPGLPPGIDAVFARALAKDPAERPLSATDLVQELDSAFHSAQPPTKVLPAAPQAAVVPESTPMRVHRHGRRRRNVAIAAVAAALALGGGAIAALIGLGAGGDRATTSASHRTSSQSTTTSSTTTGAPSADPVSLANRGFAYMQSGEYSRALPLLTRAVHALVGSGTLNEAYSEYNLAYTRFALGRCDGVLALLDRSQGIQGHRGEIDRLRARAEARCGGGPAPKKGHGKKKGHGDGGDEG